MGTEIKASTCDIDNRVPGFPSRADQVRHLLARISEVLEIPVSEFHKTPIADKKAR